MGDGPDHVSVSHCRSTHWACGSFALQSSPERIRRFASRFDHRREHRADHRPILFFQFTVTLPDHCHREVISWSLTPKMTEYIADHPGITLRQAIIEHDDDMDALFTTSSLSFMQRIFRNVDGVVHVDHARVRDDRWHTCPEVGKRRRNGYGSNELGTSRPENGVMRLRCIRRNWCLHAITSRHSHRTPRVRLRNQ